MASWTVDAVKALGSDHAIPAGCRGNGGPAALRWLGEPLRLAAGRWLVDISAGIGGPAAFARSEFGVEALLLDPMEGACRAAHTPWPLRFTSWLEGWRRMPVSGCSCTCGRCLT